MRMEEPRRGELGERYDGLAKVTGKARFAAEFGEPFARARMAHGLLVQATIACGVITALDTADASRCSGVLAIMTPFNAPRLPVLSQAPRSGRVLSLLQDAEVHYNGQPIAVVVARSQNEARAAAARLRVTYEERPAALDFAGRLATARPPREGRREGAPANRGDMRDALAAAAATVDETYVTPIQNHNPMEPHATIAWWEDEALRVYDSTQAISGVQGTLAHVFGLPNEEVRVQCPFTGGGFGGKGAAWSHVVLAAMAARVAKRPVKLVLERGQMFGPVGARPATISRIRLCAAADGKLLGIQHDAVMHGSVMEEYVESLVDPSRMLYACASNVCTERIVDLNLGVTTYMRAPGKATGTAVLEIAMDELAETLKMDPMELRLRNYAEADPADGRPWSSKNLRACYLQAAERFGWKRRPVKPGEWVEGEELIGFGMATATYPGHRAGASAMVRILANGTAYVASGTQELGTGIYTIMAQTAAETLGMDPRRVKAVLGDSTLPRAPGSSSSQSTASVMPAVQQAALAARAKLIAMAVEDAQSPLYQAQPETVQLLNERIAVRGGGGRGESVAALLARHGGQAIEATASAHPESEAAHVSCHSFGAVFAEVGVDRHSRMVRVRRVVATYDVGRMLNETTGLQQLRGGIVWGIGFALMEEAVIDPVYGRTANESLAEYHVPVNRDVGAIDVTVVGVPDMKLNPLGARGMGEIGNTGIAAAIANAVYNATGKRVRTYPITPGKLMSA